MGSADSVAMISVESDFSVSANVFSAPFEFDDLLIGFVDEGDPIDFLGPTAESIEVLTPQAKAVTAGTDGRHPGLSLLPIVTLSHSIALSKEQIEHDTPFPLNKRGLSLISAACVSGMLGSPLHLIDHATSAVKVQSDQDCQGPPKRKKADSSEPTSVGGGESVSQLHQACCRKDVSPEEVRDLLASDPQAAARPLALKSIKDIYSPILRTWITKMKNEPYMYPLNLAIKNRASPEVLSLLIEAAPGVLTKKDGRSEETSLLILLKYAPRHVCIIEKMLFVQPRCARMVDRHSNSALHVACVHSSSVAVVSHIASLCPQALRLRNFHGMTPLGLSQHRTTACSDDVHRFLLAKKDY